MLITARYAVRAVALVCALSATVISRVSVGATAGEPVLRRPTGHEGPFGVGFKSFIRRDASRGYSERGGDKQGLRPILFAIWYPAQRAEGPRMRQGEYLQLTQVDVSDREFAQRLGQSSRTAIARALASGPGRFTDGDSRNLASYLADETTARRNAAPAPGRFPLIVYHPGMGGTFDESAPLLEALASHGYVVVSSAFQPLEAQVMTLDADVDRSAADGDFIVSEMRTDPQVDEAHVGFCGRGSGGVVALAQAMRTQRLDAVVALDSGLDHAAARDLTFEDPASAILRESERLTTPALIIAAPKARFALALGFTKADLVLTKVKAGAHLDFDWLRDAAGQFEPRRTGRVSASSYDGVIRRTLAFLESKLKSLAASAASQRGRSAPSPDADGWLTQVVQRPERAPTTMALAGGMLRLGPKAGSAWLEPQVRRHETGTSELNDVIDVLLERAHPDEAFAVAEVSARVNSYDFRAPAKLASLLMFRKEWSKALVLSHESLRLLNLAKITPVSLKMGGIRSLEATIARVEQRLAESKTASPGTPLQP